MTKYFDWNPTLVLPYNVYVIIAIDGKLVHTCNFIATYLAIFMNTCYILSFQPNT